MQKKITQEEFDKAYEQHQLWLKNPETGDRMDFSDTDFCEIEFPDSCKFEKAIFKRVDLSEVDLRGFYLSGIDFFGANLREADLREADLREADLREADLSGADLEKADLSEADVSNAKLNEAILRDCNLSGATLSEANLCNADLSYANGYKAYFLEADLKKANLSNAFFDESNLCKADLSSANLQEIDLSEANLKGANLKNADLRNANLTSADFENANLCGANLNKAVLTDAKLEYAIGLINANIEAEKIWNDYHKRISELERIRLDLLSSSEDKEVELIKNQVQINKLKEEIEKKSISAGIRERIEKGFNSFDKASEGLSVKTKIFNKMFYCYLGFAVLFTCVLIFVWIRFFSIYYDYVNIKNTKMDLLEIWINILPSFLLFTLVVLCIYQAHKCIRQSVAIDMLLYKPKQIKSIMETYVSIGDEENISETKAKLYTILDNMVEHVIDNDIDLNKTEEGIKDTDDKDRSHIEKSIELLQEIIKKI